MALLFAVEQADQLPNRLRGFVAHVGDAEGRALDLAVATVDEHTPVLDELLEFRDVDRAPAGFGAVVNANQRARLVALFREQREAVTGSPVPQQVVRLEVAPIARVEALGEDVLQLRRQRVDVADARRARRHALLGVLL
ncbi:MAG TPA: hypothetical protein PKZ77_07660, partial [Pseudomonadales bacterium]|nr:hypothetical protein [Pseudomonadales bacterium]